MPDGEESVDVAVVEEEDRVEGAVRDEAHPAADHAVDGVVDAFERVVPVAAAVDKGMV